MPTRPTSSPTPVIAVPWMSRPGMMRSWSVHTKEKNPRIVALGMDYAVARHIVKEHNVALAAKERGA